MSYRGVVSLFGGGHSRASDRKEDRPREFVLQSVFFVGLAPPAIQTRGHFFYFIKSGLFPDGDNALTECPRHHRLSKSGANFLYYSGEATFQPWQQSPRSHPGRRGETSRCFVSHIAGSGPQRQMPRLAAEAGEYGVGGNSALRLRACSDATFRLLDVRAVFRKQSGTAPTPRGVHFGDSVWAVTFPIPGVCRLT